ncbi:MAG: SoxR reducing system RseC family protein [Chlorobi bacterium]|nr:SoxR reducing system RseC family protein [Chlorobiota bacterium]
MQDNKSIEHSGVVHSIENGIIKVGFATQSACASCLANGVCSVPEDGDKEVEIIDKAGKYKIGEKVDIVLQESLGLRALFLGYLLPFLILFFVLIVLSNIMDSELLAGLISLFCLIPYYLVLYLQRDKLKKTFSFNLKKIV